MRSTANHATTFILVVEQIVCGCLCVCVREREKGWLCELICLLFVWHLLYVFGCSTVIAEESCAWMGLRGHFRGRVERKRGHGGEGASFILSESSMDQFSTKQQNLCDATMDAISAYNVV